MDSYSSGSEGEENEIRNNSTESEREDGEWINMEEKIKNRLEGMDDGMWKSDDEIDVQNKIEFY